MNKILNYIRNGKGFGLLFLLAAAVLITIVIMGVMKNQYTAFRPQLINTMDEFLPMTVQGGQIVSPENTYKKVDLKFGENDDNAETVSIVLDTRAEATDVSFDKVGLYIMKDVMYVVSPSRIERLPLKDGVWDKQSTEELLDYVISVLWLVSSVVVVIMLFVIFLIKTLFLAWLGKLGLKISGKLEAYNFGYLMRLSAIVMAVLETVFLTLGMFLPVTGWQRFIIELVLVWLFISREKSAQA